MFNENQLVNIKWNNTNKEWYTLRGYRFTKRYDTFQVKAKDLMKHSQSQIEVTCDYCGKIFTTKFSTMIIGRKFIEKDACSNCAGRKLSDVNKNIKPSKYFPIIQEICNREGYRLITDISELSNVKTKFKFLCPKHGEQSMIIDNFIRGHRCIKCSYEQRMSAKRLDKQYITKVIQGKGDQWINPNEYTNCVDRNLKIKCKCGNIFTTSFVNFRKFNIFRCPKCSSKESLGELLIRDFLDQHNIKYEQEKRFNDCKDKKPLPFDFYLPEYNICIEFDGQYHYQDIFGINALEKTRRHDNIKNLYCYNNDIKIIRIPFWEGNNIADILSKEIVHR